MWDYIIRMKHNGYKQILNVCYVIIICCCFAPNANAWRLGDTQEESIMQNHVPALNRRGQLKLLSTLLGLQQLNTEDFVNPEDLENGAGVGAAGLYQYPNYMPSLLQQDGERQQPMLPAVKRQPPCFWSVVTCY